MLGVSLIVFIALSIEFTRFIAKHFGLKGMLVVCILMILGLKLIAPSHAVVTVAGDAGNAKSYMRRVCADCPWRKDAVGVFPPEAFRHSAETAADMAMHTFACHTAGTANTKICAGFLLRGADHNLTVRLLRMRGQLQDDVDATGHELHAGYRSMAIANGVPSDDPSLASSRLSHQEEQDDGPG